MNKLAWLEAEARQFFHLINIAVVIDLINSYQIKPNLNLASLTSSMYGICYRKENACDCLDQPVSDSVIHMIINISTSNLNVVSMFKQHTM